MRSGIIILLIATVCAANISQDEWEADLQRGLEEFLKTGQKSHRLNNVLVDLKFPNLFRKKIARIEKHFVQKLICGTCKVGLGVAIASRRLGVNSETLRNIMVSLCTWLKIEPEEVCQGFIDNNIDIWLYIIDNRPELTSKRICSIALQDFQCEDSERVSWSVDISHRNSPQIVDQVTKPTDEPLKMLHITDFHYDPEYGAESNANCDFPLCCQKGSKPNIPGDAAGYWGDYRNCDMPWYGIQSLLAHIKSEHSDIDLVYFTGDIIGHKVWATNISNVSRDITKVYQTFRESFGNISVYPILGNHESHPVNQFSSEGLNSSSKLNTQWVFNLTAKLWEPWLTSETAETISKGGYYTVMVKPGFRVVALNSNVCYIFNWWLFYDDEDPYGQLRWLADTLLRAELNNERVHILSHVPSGDSTCLYNWSREYAKIINRFSHIIAAQFNGHTHLDDTVIYFSTENRTEAINVAFNGGSVTTYSNLNPNYKVYEINRVTAEVINFESWMYNVTKSNKEAHLLPKWYKLYDFKNAYGVSNLHPQDIAMLVERMTKDAALSQNYFRYKNRDAVPALTEGCDANCELENICYMVTSVQEDNWHCNLYAGLYQQNRPSRVEKAIDRVREKVSNLLAI